MARLQHPHILPLIDSGDAEGMPFYVMPYVQGESLRARLDRGSVGQDEAVSILRDMLRALQYAHEQGIVHRDVEPENVLLSSGSAVLADLGIAKALSDAAGGTDAAASLTRTGTSIGPPAYMAPEQAAADPTTGAPADIYAWGMVAWETLGGRHPFAGAASPQAMMAAQFSEMPVSLDTTMNVSALLAGVVQRALAKAPHDRWRSAGELLSAFDEALRSGQYVAGTHAKVAKTRRVDWLAACSAVVLAVVGTLLWKRAGVDVPDIRTVAVIPVQGSTGDSATSYVTDGIVDDLTSLLQAEGALRVINRASAFALRGRTLDLARVSSQLGVDHVVQVSGRPDGAGYRLVVDLVDVQTAAVKWSQRFDAPRDSASALPPRIAEALLSGIRSPRTPGTGTVVIHAPLPAAYDAYLRGCFFRQRLAQATDVDSALHYLFRATEIDPQFAAPYAVLAGLYVDISGGAMRVSEAYAMADSMAGRAVVLDPRNAEGLAVRGWCAAVRSWDWDVAQRDLDAAVKADPNSSTIRFYRGFLRWSLADWRGSVEDLRHGSHSDPFFALTWFARVISEAKVGQIDSAFVAQRHLDEIAPGYTVIGSNIGGVFRMLNQPDSALRRDSIADRFTGKPTAGTALSLLALSRRAEAEAHLERMKAAYRATPMLPEYMARVAMALGRRDEALTWLERALDERSDLIPYVLQMPEMRPLRADSRVEAMLQRMNAPEGLRRSIGGTS